MKLKRFSQKQLQALTWWTPQSPVRHRDAIICDGAVRSGKTLSLSVSFVLWAMGRYRDRSFALCGKTLASLRRNVVIPLLRALRQNGISCEEKISHALFTVAMGEHTNTFYLFGGRDEGSAALIQGATLAGVLFDEVALMPRSFVEQALARCSEPGSRFWFSCNPEHPGHWFYREWILQSAARNALYLHFTMADNPALSRRVRARYERLYDGAAYQRYVQGRWVAEQGAVYPMFRADLHIVDQLPPLARYVLSCDHGTRSPASFGLWGYSEEKDCWFRVREYYYDARETGVQRTDGEYAEAVEHLAGGLPVEAAVVDPSASNLILLLRRRCDFPVHAADNDVLTGIRTVAEALRARRIRVHRSCRACIREFGLYRWNPDADADVPLKQDDHAMDDTRYFAMYALKARQSPGVHAIAVARRQP